MYSLQNNEITVFQHLLRNIHEAFQPFMPEDAHEYCVLYLACLTTAADPPLADKR
jgi:hypothetical protein